MKALRRSIKGEKENKAAPLSIQPKSAIAIVPPKKVIRALYDYEARSSQELSFSHGDFFHVIGRENDNDWYEACNPAQADARGLVPVAYFQALGRNERDSSQSDGGGRPIGAKNPDHDSGYSEGPPQSAPLPTSAGSAQRQSRSGKSGAMVYGIVMYDFHAERADELEAKAGEAIIVIAQSNAEWFVAKPIGRLGGPGLIPVSFVEIRDMATNKAVENPDAAIRAANVPRVEEWKKMVATYKESSITLGKFEQMPPQTPGLEQSMDRLSLQQGSRPSQNGNPQQPGFSGQQPQRPQQSQQSPYAPQAASPGPVSARIPRYCYAEDKYWFVIEAVLEDGRHWELSRYYEDFYDFQIALLTEFPAEAGNTGTQKRTLPYMPGPVNYVTDAITEGRLHNLDAYVKNLLQQPPYIARCSLVKQFFAPREGDFEIDPNEGGEEYRLSGTSQPSSTDSPADRGASRQTSRNNLNGNGYSPATSAGQIPRSNGQPAPAMKIKVHFQGEFIAILVPGDIQFNQLYDKLLERLKIPPTESISVTYRDEQTGEKMGLMNDQQLYMAMQRNEKLVLYVD